MKGIKEFKTDLVLSPLGTGATAPSSSPARLRELMGTGRPAPSKGPCLSWGEGNFCESPNPVTHLAPLPTGPQPNQISGFCLGGPRPAWNFQKPEPHTSHFGI